MKYFFSIIYLVVGVILPLVYLSIVETNKINSREIFLLILIFIFCTGAGIRLAFAKRAVSKEQTKPRPIRSVSERIKDHASIGRVVPIEEPKNTSSIPDETSSLSDGLRRVIRTPSERLVSLGGRTAEKRTVTKPPEKPKPEIQTLTEDIKNLIKLESWLMALQKTNELIHYYPDSPESDKIRENINFLIKKVQENRQR